jgi:hypothetical protein
MPDIGFVGGGEAAKVGMAKRRVWIMTRDGSGKQQLTNDPAYRDERPQWLSDAQHLLFARLDTNDDVSLWLMRADGSELTQVASGLALPPSNTAEPSLWFGYYGHIGWSNYFALWTRATPTKLPNSGGARPNLWPILMVGLLMRSAGFVLIRIGRAECLHTSG